MLPIDVEFVVWTPYILASTTQAYVQKLQNRLQWAYKTAQEVNKKERDRSKRCFDNKIRCVKLEPGDLVLVQQKAFKGKHKIQDRWENVPYNVLEHIRPNLSIYQVQMEGENIKTRVLYRTLLFPLICSNLGEDHNVQQQNMNEENETSHSSNSVDSGVNPQDNDNMSYWSAKEDEAPYSGPVMRSRAKNQKTTA